MIGIEAPRFGSGRLMLLGMLQGGMKAVNKRPNTQLENELELVIL